MFYNLNNINRLLNIIDRVSAEAQTEILMYAMQVEEREKLEKQEILKGKTVFYKNIEKKAQEKVMKVFDFGIQCCEKMDSVHLAALFLKAKELAGESTEYISNIKYKLIKEQTEIPMQEYFDKALPGVQYEDALVILRQWKEFGVNEKEK